MRSNCCLHSKLIRVDGFVFNLCALDGEVRAMSET